MVSRLDINQATVSNYSGQPTTSIAPQLVDSPTDQKETEWDNPEFNRYWGMFNEVGTAKSAFLMKSVWNVGKGYTADLRTTIILENINGMGKDTFDDILFNQDLIKNLGGDSYAEQVRDPETNVLLNLKPMNPADMSHFVGSDGTIIRYEQRVPFPKKGIMNTIKNFVGKKKVIPFKPEEIFHLQNNRLANQIHGISDMDAMERVILADKESFADLQKMQHFQVRPFIIFKMKTDDDTTINNFITKVENTRKKGEDLFIPDDDNLLEWEIVQVNPSSIIMEWRRDLKNEFYRTVGMPEIIFGTSGSTESGGKIEYTGHEQVWEHNQRYLERQVWNQLALKIDLISPASLIQNLQTDEAKDANQGLEFQQSDVTAGAGK